MVNKYLKNSFDEKMYQNKQIRIEEVLRKKRTIIRISSVGGKLIHMHNMEVKVKERDTEASPE